MIKLILTPADNQRLANLCGVLDENITQIARSLNINIARHGDQFNISGHDSNTKRAVELLKGFYHRAQHPIDLEEIQLGLIELEEQGSTALHHLPHIVTKRGILRGRTPKQVSYLKQIQTHDITFGIGPAGTGKTYLAVASAISAINQEQVKHIVLVRPAVEAGEHLGFLPGDLTQKVDPYLRPLYDALYDLAGYESVIKMIEKNMIEIAPLAYMRGRTLNHSFIIMDEAQNTTPEQMKMFLTRIGFGTKAVVTGDITQIDLQPHQKSGLVEAQHVLQSVPDIAMTHFSASDVVRHPLVQKIINAYAEHNR